MWGLIGAAANRGVKFLEASEKVKGWPWVQPHGPGGGVYAASIAINLGVAGMTVGAVATTGWIVNEFVAFALGVGAATLVKKAGEYASSFLPWGRKDGRRLGTGDADET